MNIMGINFNTDLRKYYQSESKLGRRFFPSGLNILKFKRDAPLIN
jgi:hypothetical protein